MNIKLLFNPAPEAGVFSILRTWFFLLLYSSLIATVLLAQTSTTVNLSTQGKNPDFSAMPVTRPVSVGTSLPSTCALGQLFFNTSASAGSNLYSCTTTNTWTVIGGATLTSPLPVSNGGTGTATPSLVAGTNVNVTGTWPNQTVSASGTGGSSGNATSIQGSGVSGTAPTNNQTLIYYGSSSTYIPTSIYTLQNGLGTAAVGATSLQVNISMGIRAVTGTADTIIGTDCGALITYNNSSAVAAALPQPALGGNFLAGCPITIHNYGAGAVTFTPAASTIGGSASQAVNQNKGCLLVSDGTNWQLGNCN